MGKVLKIIFNTLLVIIIILLAVYCFLRFTDRVRIYNVETGSMEDKIHTGDYILLVKKDNYYVGDVVTYRVDGYFVTHRIVKIEDGIITTKGDANNKEDLGITNDMIEGKVIYVGGVLNFVIEYKYVIVVFLVGLYLLSCYFGNDDQVDEINEDLPSNEKIEQVLLQEEIEKPKRTKKEIVKEKPKKNTKTRKTSKK